MTISDSSSYIGSINSNGTSAASLSVTIDSSSTWTLTGDSYITEFNGSMDNVVTNGFTLYVNGTVMNQPLINLCLVPLPYRRGGFFYLFPPANPFRMKMGKVCAQVKVSHSVCMVLRNTLLALSFNTYSFC